MDKLLGRCSDNKHFWNHQLILVIQLYVSCPPKAWLLCALHVSCIPIIMVTTDILTSKFKNACHKKVYYRYTHIDKCHLFEQTANAVTTFILHIKRFV